MAVGALDERAGEIRWRGTVCLSALVAGFLVASIPAPVSLTSIVLAILTAPAEWQLTEPDSQERIWANLYIGCILAALFAQPVILRQVLDFLSPDDTLNRQKRINVVVIAVVASCAAGILFAYWYLLVQTLPLTTCTMCGFQVKWMYTEYVEPMARFMFGAGPVTAMPALMFGLAWLRITSRRRLAAGRKYAVLIAAIVAACITPTPDILNQMLVALPMYAFYEFGLLVAWFVPADSREPSSQSTVAVPSS